MLEGKQAATADKEQKTLSTNEVLSMNMLLTIED
jgi:hypothetical protein